MTHRTSAKTSRTAFENSVSVASMTWLAGQGDYTLVNEDDLEVLGFKLESNDPHPSIKPLLDVLSKGEPEPSEYLEILLEYGFQGFIIELTTPIPRDFKQIDPIKGHEETFCWSESWGLTTSRVVYCTSLAEVSKLMAEFRSDVVNRELDKHKAELQAQKLVGAEITRQQSAKA